MSNLGDSNTPIEGESFGLPAGAELTEDANGNLAIADSGGSIVLVRDETAGEWQFENTDLTGINAIDASSATFTEASFNTASVTSEPTDDNDIARLFDVESAGNPIFFQDARPDVPQKTGIWGKLERSLTAANTDPGTPVTKENSSPPVDGSILYALTQSGIFAIDISDGSTNWTFAGLYLYGGVLDDSGDLYAANDDTLKKIDSSGNEVWSTTTPDAGRVRTPLVLFDGSIWCVSQTPRALEVDPSDGSIIQSASVSMGGGQPRSRLFVDNNGFIFGGDNAVYSLSPSDLSVENWTQGGYSTVRGGPAATSDHVVIGDNGTCDKLDRTDGSVTWTQSVSSIVGTQITIADDAVYFAESAGEVYSVDLSDGSVNWSTTTADTIGTAGIRVDGHRLVTYDDSGNLYAFDVSQNGLQLWSSSEASSTDVGGSGIAEINGELYTIFEGALVETTTDGYAAIEISSNDSWYGETA